LPIASLVQGILDLNRQGNAEATGWFPR